MPLDIQTTWVFIGLMFGFLFLGEFSKNPGYFVAAVIPIIYVMAEINQPIFTVLGYGLIAFSLVMAALYFFANSNKNKTPKE